MRKRVGVAAINNRKDEAQKFQAIGSKLEDTKITFVREALENFKSTLAEFAIKHKDRINNDPEFRMQFHSMCNSVGVDPLSSSKGFWSDLLGIGEYYFRLGVVIIQSCVMLRSMNGGIIPIDKILQHIRLNPAFSTVSIEDIKRAMKKLEVLGDGFRLLDTGGTTVIISVPIELNNDHEALLEMGYSSPMNDGDAINYVSESFMQTARGWSRERFTFAVHPLLKEGILWLDMYKGEERFYFPSFNQK